jgi:hypothetical protein
MDTMSTEPTSTSGDTRTIRTFTNYLDAQAAVDFLSDGGFPVENVKIVGREIRLVESVSGRLTKGRAALAGAGGGAWFGLLIGVLLGIFLPGGVWISLILSAVLFAAAWGALFGFVGHWATRGRRDFSSTQRLEAGYYDVLVDTLFAEDAEAMLAKAPAAPARA